MLIFKEFIKCSVSIIECVSLSINKFIEFSFKMKLNSNACILFRPERNDLTANFFHANESSSKLHNIRTAFSHYFGVLDVKC